MLFLNMPFWDSRNVPVWRVDRLGSLVPRLMSVSLSTILFLLGGSDAPAGNAMTQMAAEHANQGALQPDGSTRKESAIDAKHVASSIVHIASLPLDVTVLEMNIMQVASSQIDPLLTLPQGD